MPTHVPFFFTPSQPAGQLRGLHSPPVSWQGKAGLFVGREGAEHPLVLTGQQWLTKPLPSSGVAGELLFSLFQRKFLSGFTQLCNCKYSARNILGAASPFCIYRFENSY